MKQVIPAYYGQFHCLAEACPDSCCRLWEIGVDDETRRLWSQIPGKLGERLRNALVAGEDGAVVLAKAAGNCALWDADGLCAVQKDLGQKALCQICREYPRMVQDYGDFAELDLELSCPAAARLILAQTPARPMIQDVVGGEPPAYDPELMRLLLESRGPMLELVSDLRLPLGQALAVGLLYAGEIQKRLDGGQASPFSREQALQTAWALAAPGERPALRQFYLSLEILTEDWEALLNGPIQKEAWCPELRAFARYELNRYWLHAAWDFDLMGRVKMVLAACILLRDLCGGPPERRERMIALYSKEVDDDADNLAAIFDAGYTAAALTDQRILGLLLDR